jgi:hypothetical protein
MATDVEVAAAVAALNTGASLTNTALRTPVITGGTAAGMSVSGLQITGETADRMLFAITDGAVVDVTTADGSSSVIAASVPDETGTGALVFGTAPTLANPTSTGVSTNAAILLTGDLTMTGVSSKTGTGKVVLDTAPTIDTPTIASFASANHGHGSAAAGGQLSETAFNSGTTYTIGIASITNLTAGAATTIGGVNPLTAFQATNANLTALASSNVIVSKAWATDSGGVPGWRDYSTGSGTSAPDYTAVGPGSAVTSGNLVAWAGTTGTNLVDSGADIADFQPASANLTNWALVLVAAKQDALGFTPQVGSVNLTNWSAITTGSKQGALVNSAGLAAALTDETGSPGLAVFSASPTLTNLTVTATGTISNIVAINSIRTDLIYVTNTLTTWSLASGYISSTGSVDAAALVGTNGVSDATGDLRTGTGGLTSKMAASATIADITEAAKVWTSLHNFQTLNFTRPPSYSHTNITGTSHTIDWPTTPPDIGINVTGNFTFAETLPTEGDYPGRVVEVTMNGASTN